MVEGCDIPWTDNRKVMVSEFSSCSHSGGSPDCDRLKRLKIFSIVVGVEMYYDCGDVWDSA